MRAAGDKEESMIINAYAKINWSLDTVGVREDGYHLLDMIMQTVSLHDTLTMEIAPALTLRTEGPVPVLSGPDNLALRAAQALREYANIGTGADIRLHKRIPIGAGLGGGSSDAAAVLRGLNRLWKLGLPDSTLAQISLPLGADIPYCLHGGLCRVQGIGEKIYPLKSGRVWQLVIIQPCRGLSTRQVFGALGEAEPSRHPDIPGAARALEEGSLSALAASMGNTLQEVSIQLRPQIRQALTALKEHGARAALMTGSGSAVFGVFSDERSARTAGDSLSKKYPVCHVCRTMGGL